MTRSLDEVAQMYRERGWKVKFTRLGTMVATRAFPPITIAKLMTVESDKSWKSIQFDALFAGGPWADTKKPLPRPCNELVIRDNQSGYYMYVDWDRGNDEHQAPNYGGLITMRWFDHPQAVEFAKSTLVAESINESTIIANPEMIDTDVS